MGIALECLSWKEAETHLHPGSIIVIPLGAALKEHGFHLQLRNDWLMAEYLRQEIINRADVLVLPTVNYGYYPAFVEYPGSVSLSLETSAQMMSEICLSIAAFGPKLFYVINTGISTLQALQISAEHLNKHGIVLKYTNLHESLETTRNEIEEQEGGSHADEIETSIMLQIAEDTVRMELASKDYQANSEGRLTRDSDSGFSFSPSGVWGDATLATKAKGEIVVKCLVESILKDIENLRSPS